MLEVLAPGHVLAHLTWACERWYARFASGLTVGGGRPSRQEVGMGRTQRLSGATTQNARTRRTTWGRRIALLLGATLLTALAACGTPGSTPPAGARPPTTSDVASALPGAPTALDDATLLARKYAALPQGRTPEGYYVLGRPDAPVVLTHYSDFL